MMRRTKIVTGVAAAVVALSGAGAGIAVAADQPSAPAPGTDQPTQPTQPDKNKDKGQHKGKHKKKGKSLLAHAEHGELALGGKQHKVVDLQRGDVTAVSPTSIAVRSEDGFTATYVVNQQTKVRHAKQQGQIGDVHTGDKVQIVATKSGTTLTATAVGDGGAPKTK